MLCHVDLEFLGIGFFRWLPAGFVCFVVEVVREVLAVAVADFPVWRQTCVGLGYMLCQGMDNLWLGE